EVAGSLAACDIAEQKLATPDRAVGAEAATIENRPYGPVMLAMFSQAGGEMGMVMLHRDVRRGGSCQRICRRKEIRMQIVGDDIRMNGKQSFEVFDGTTVRLKGFVVLEIADVRTDPGPPILDEAESIFEVGAAGKDGSCDPR